MGEVLAAASRALGDLLNQQRNPVPTGDQPESTLTLSFWCLGGRHRSVACARIAADVVLSMSGLRLDGVLDLTPSSDTPASCRFCEECQFFSRAWPDRERALEQGRRVWSQCFVR
jgi:hypothetical protein